MLFLKDLTITKHVNTGLYLAPVAFSIPDGLAVAPLDELKPLTGFQVANKGAV